MAKKKETKVAQPLETVGAEVQRIGCIVQCRFRDKVTKATLEVGEVVLLELERAEDCIKRGLVKLAPQPAQAAATPADGQKPADTPSGDNEEEQKEEGAGDEAGTGARATQQ
ncbi:MAG: hypothetical protein LBN29_01335 [Mediterranea sp.]|jgi:hypothetical protein|nr:hypothetical protein [Mediterranea sp.]